MKPLSHIIEARQFDRALLDRLFSEADILKKQALKHRVELVLSGKSMITLFYEPSTRTRVSFEQAMQLLGGSVISTENARQFSSAIKGETLEDTIKVLDTYHFDVIVMRHHEEGAARRAASVSPTPIINAGDGIGEHPTQTLLDLYTIYQAFGAFDGLSIALIGDLKQGRAARSLAFLLGSLGVKKIYCVAPEMVQMKNDVKEYLTTQGIPYEETDNLESIAHLVDVMYQNRVKKEYFDSEEAYNKAKGKCIINTDIVSLMKPEAVILHPLPRNDEIDSSVDTDPRALYFSQAQNGLYIRMALLKMILA